MTINLDEITLNSDIDPVIKLDIVHFHELVHYYQTGMTGYGQLRWMRYREAIAIIIDDWIKATNSSQFSRPMPIGYMMTLNVEGLSSAAKITFKGHYSLAMLKLQNEIPPSYITANDLLLPLLKGNFELAPQIKVHSENYRINGIDIIESHAKILEALYASSEHDIPFDKILDRDILSKHYYYIFDWFCESIGGRYINDFLAICDLSLQIDRWGMFETQNDWEKHHPGWRFYHLTKCLLKNKSLIFKNDNDMVQRYLEYGKTLFDECKYSSLDMVFNKCLSMYDYGCEKDELMGLEKRMQELITFRTKNVWLGAHPFIERKTWEYTRKNFHPLFFQVEDDLFILPTNDDDIPKDQFLLEGILLESTFELHYQALANQILGKISLYSKDIEEIQCGFGYFGLKKGCPYMFCNKCTGSFRPDKGSPISWEKINKEKFSGCNFMAMLDIMGINHSKLIDYNYKKLPSMNELKKQWESYQ